MQVRSIALAAILPFAPFAGACSSVPAPGALATRAPLPDTRTAEGITFHAEMRIIESSPLTLRTTVTATNSGGRRRHVEVPGGCTVLLRAYQNPYPLGGPAWDEADHLACEPRLAVLTLEPGETKTFQTTVTAREILGRALPAARYHVTAVIRPNGEWIELAAGNALLTR